MLVPPIDTQTLLTDLYARRVSGESCRNLTTIVVFSDKTFADSTAAIYVE